MVLLGTIVVPSGGSANNTNTAVPFTIHATYSRVLLVTPSASNVTFCTTVGSSSALAATASDFGLAEQTSSQITCPNPPPAAGTVLAIYGSGGGGSVLVYGLYGQAQS